MYMIWRLGVREKYAFSVARLLSSKSVTSIFNALRKHIDVKKSYCLLKIIY